MSNSGKLSVEELPPITFDQTPNLTTDYIATCHPSTASCLCGAQKPMWALKITDMVLLGEFSTLDGAAVIYRNKDQFIKSTLSKDQELKVVVLLGSLQLPPPPIAPKHHIELLSALRPPETKQHQ